MSLNLSQTQVENILTRTSGFLKTVTSHSLQPYRGCTFGRSLCGVGCYVQHNRFLTRNQSWGSFLEVRENAAAAYERQYASERRWARRNRGEFSIFMSSATDPFLVQENRYRISRKILETMLNYSPDLIILQTHTHRVAQYLDLLCELATRCRLRVHLSIESDTDRIPGLPPPASSVEQRFEAAQNLKAAGLQVIVTVAPLLPIRQPEAFFGRLAQCADAVVIDHFIQGDGSASGSRTRRTQLPAAMAAVDPESVGLAYRDQMEQVAQRLMPGRVGVNIDGFAGRFTGNRS